MPRKAKEKPERGEELRRDLPTKAVYHFVDTEQSIDVKSSEIFKKSKKIVHYPFTPRTGRQNYNSIAKITYEGFSGPLPSGFLKAPTTGYGFTKELSPLLWCLQDRFPGLQHLVVTKSGDSEFASGRKIVLSLKDLDKARPKISSMLSQHRGEIETLATNLLAGILPDKFTKQTQKYRAGQLDNFIGSHSLKPGQLSTADVATISGLIGSLPAAHQFVKEKGILSTKESFDRIYIEDIMERFKQLLLQRTDTDTLENRWQEFLSDNILYFNFGYVERFEKERIQGDKTIDIPDFILLNTYSYLDIFEIKTHLTQLLCFDKGRKNFHWSAEASKAISQAENYIDAVTKEEDTIIKNIGDEYGIHTVDAVRPVVYIIAGSKPKIAGPATENKYKGGMKVKLWNDFRRLNNSLKNTSFVLYDELLAVFENTLKRLRSASEES